MKTLVIQTKNEDEVKFLSQLLKKLGVSSKVLDMEDAEDYGMSLLMKDADRTKKVNRDAIMRKLKS